MSVMMMMVSDVTKNDDVSDGNIRSDESDDTIDIQEIDKLIAMLSKPCVN